ncbi:MAG TPA: Trm112 family protein [Aquifex aeolicus]|nr:Trm112 family protein [Aquifex aeolicus]
MLEKELIEILACPKCKGDLLYDNQKEVLICENCKVFYEIKDGIPILLEEEAKPIVEEK